MAEPAPDQPDARQVRVLIVDDSPLDAGLARGLLQNAGYEDVVVAANGNQALDEIERSPPGLVVTDLRMPGLDGLALVQRIRHERPLIPVILMTGHGSEDIAVEALQKGAASYVPKPLLAKRLAQTVRSVMAVALSKREQRRLSDFCLKTEFEFSIENDVRLIMPLLSHLHDYMTQLQQVDATEVTRVGIALHEALTNAIHHGNLELSSSIREDDSDSYFRLAEERRHREPYRNRRVTLKAVESPDEAVYTIGDMGSGFDTEAGLAYDPTDPAQLSRPHGRGLFLIRTFMSEVRFNATGNQITLIHRRRTETAPT